MPPNQTTGNGTVTVTFDPTTKRITWDGTYSGLSGPATGAHFQGPAEPGKNAVVVVTITPATSPLQGSATLTDAQAVNLMAGRWYVNIYTKAHEGGELRGQLVEDVSPLVAQFRPLEGRAITSEIGISGTRSGHRQNRRGQSISGRARAALLSRLHKARPSPFQNIGLSRYDVMCRALGKAMRRRSRSGGKPVNTRRRKTVTLKRAMREGGAPFLRFRSRAEIARLTSERNEAVEQQTATSEVLAR